MLYCPNDFTVPMTLLFQWLYCPNDFTLPMTLLSQWLYSPNDFTLPMTLLSQWLYCPNEFTVPMTLLSQWLEPHWPLLDNCITGFQNNLIYLLLNARQQIFHTKTISKTKPILRRNGTTGVATLYCRWRKYRVMFE